MQASGSRALSLGQRRVRRSMAALTSSGHSHARPEHLQSVWRCLQPVLQQMTVAPGSLLASHLAIQGRLVIKLLNVRR